MRSLKINNGIKEFAINDDENKVLKRNTTDIQIAQRLKQSEKELNQIAEECKNIGESMSEDEAIDLFDKYDKKVKTTLDYIFNANVSEVVFGNMNCLSICDGKPMFQNFIDAIMPEIETDIQAESKKSKANIKKYTSQVRK